MIVAEVGAVGRLEAEMGIVRRNTRWLPDAHPEQTAGATYLGPGDGQEARADLHRPQRQRWETIRITDLCICIYVCGMSVHGECVPAVPWKIRRNKGKWRTMIFNSGNV